MCYKMHVLVYVLITFSYIVTQVISWMTWNSNCYHFSSNELRYSLASEACSDLYSYLVEIETTAEHGELVQHMSATKHYWAGIQRNSNNKHFWVHGGSLVQSSLWVSYAPNDNVDCARFRGDTNGKLDDKSCTTPFNYICEKTEDESADYFCDGNLILTGNVASGKMSSAYYSSTNNGLVTDTLTGTCGSTDSGPEVWWLVDLIGHYLVNNVVITSTGGQELQDLTLLLYSMNSSVYGSHANYTMCASFVGPANGISADIKCSFGAAGRWLRIVKSSTGISNMKLTLCEVEVYGVACSKIRGSTTCEKPIITYNVTAFHTTTEITSTQYQTTPSETTTEKGTTTPSEETTTSQDTTTSDSTSSQNKVTTPSETTTYSTGSSNNMIDTTTFVAMTTSAETTGNASMSTECFCPCSSMQSSNISDKELTEIIDKIKKELTVDSKTTNAYIRTLTSADDKRTSARSVGSLGLVILVATFLFFISGDVINVGAYLFSKIRIMKKRKHYDVRY